MSMSNKNNVIKTKYFRNKINEYEKEKINNKLNENDNNTQYSQTNNSNSTKKEYPNMAKFLYGKRPSSDVIDEEEIKSAKNKDTKAIKKI